MKYCPVCSSNNIGAKLTNEWVRCFDCGYEVSKQRIAENFHRMTILIDALAGIQKRLQVIEEIKAMAALASFKQNSSYFMKKEGKYWQ